MFIILHLLLFYNLVNSENIISVNPTTKNKIKKKIG